MRSFRASAAYGGTPVYRIDIISDISDPFASGAPDIRNDRAAVFDIQQALEDAGGFLSAAGQQQPDGIWGPKTAEATLAFQIAKFFAPTDQDGIPGPETLDALGVQLGPATDGGGGGAVGQVPAGTVAPVADIQTLLTADGFPTAVDGIWGPNTQGAVTQLQQTVGTTVDGIVGAGTWAIMQTLYSSSHSDDLTLPSGFVVAGSAHSDPASFPIPDPSGVGGGVAPGPKDGPPQDGPPQDGPPKKDPPAVIPDRRPAMVIVGLAALAGLYLLFGKKKRKKRRA